MTVTVSASPNISLMFVEDESDAREITRDLLSRNYRDLNIHVAMDGMAGLALFNAVQPEIVVTDITLPGMNGLAMAREIRRLNPETLLIALTAHSDTDYLLDAIEIGITHYILKPIVYRKLFAALDGCIRDIRMRRQFRAQDGYIRKLSSAVEGSPCSIMITDLHGVIEYVNPKFSSVSGFAAVEVVGRTPSFMKSGLTPAECYDKLWATVRSGKEWHGELLNRKHDGSLFWERVSISPIFDASGSATHFIAIKEDITDEKHAAQQIEQLNLQLAATATDLEAFNYTVSHDLRIPLTLVTGYCQLIQELQPINLSGKCREYLGEIRSAAQRMNQLISTLLDFSRLSRRELQRQSIDMSELVRLVLTELGRTAPERQVEVIVQEGILVEGDPALMRVLLENLLGNSWKYTSMKETGKIEFGEVTMNGRSTCRIKDNGIGFDMADAEQLFAPFQRLPGSGGYAGAGIGLATVRRIVQRHGGTVWAEAAPGAGATFYFALA